VIDIDGRTLVRELVALLREDAVLRRELAAALAGEQPSRAHVTIAEYARARSVSPSTVRAAIREGRLPSLRVGRAVRVPSDVEIANRTTRLGVLNGGRR